MTAAKPLMDTVDDLLTPAEVARLFRVDPKTVARWDKEGKLTSVKTLGGHRRYPRTQLSVLLDGGPSVDEVIESLETVHALAVRLGAAGDADRIRRLALALRAME